MATTAGEKETPTSHGRGETGQEGTVEPVDREADDGVVTTSRVAAAPNDYTTRSAFSNGSWGTST